MNAGDPLIGIHVIKTIFKGIFQKKFYCSGKKIAPVNICVHWSYLRKYYIYFLILPFTQDDSLAILLLYQKQHFVLAWLLKLLLSP